MLANGLVTIVFMNFIIAEVGNSYNVIKESLHQKLLKQRGLMINEAEDICRSRYSSNRVKQWKHFFPKYIITRELDE